MLEIAKLSDDFEFHKGQEKEFMYKVSNVGPYISAEIEVEAYTVFADDGSKTEPNYVKSIDYGAKMLIPDREFVAKVIVKLPEDYNETYVIKDGKYKGLEVTRPIDIVVKVNEVERATKVSV